MNILIVNHYAGSVYHGMEYRPYYLAREWIRGGHEVTIIAADQSHLRNKKVEMATAIKQEKIDGINYLWLRTIEYQGNGLKRAINMASFIGGIFRFSRQITEIVQPDVIIASSTYPLDIFPCHFLAKKSGAKLIYEIHDLWPLSPMELGQMPWYHPFILGMQLAENWCYRYSDAVISMLPKVLEHVTAHGLEPKKLHVIPNGICTDEWQIIEKIPGDLSDKVKSEREKGNFIIAYCGGHAISNSLDTILEAASRLKSEKISFFFIGSGEQKDRLIRRTEEFQLKNVLFYNSVPKTSIPSLLECFDCLILTWAKRWNLYKHGVSPNKIMDYMMSGKPIIQAIEAGNDLVKEANCGISVPAENSVALAEAVLKMLNTSLSDRKSLGENGRNYVKMNHDYKILAKKFLDVIAGL